MNIKTNPNHIDERGTISMILESCEVRSISRIECFPNTTRAKHWHKNDGHWIIVNFGSMEYYERAANTDEVPKKVVLRRGDIFFTGPGLEHEMYFPDFCEFDCYSLLPRDSASYENETFRFTHSLKSIYESVKKVGVAPFFSDVYE